jgi:hypothetical protein
MTLADGGGAPMITLGQRGRLSRSIVLLLDGVILNPSPFPRGR